MNEAGVYLAVSSYLKDSGWLILGGQPPSGTDHLPVIEIKDPSNREKGSRGSYKPDLVAWSGTVLLLVELKPRFSRADRRKLTGILKDSLRIDALWREVDQRGLLDAGGVHVSRYRGTSIVHGALGFSGPPGALEGLWALRVDPTGRVTLDCQT